MTFFYSVRIRGGRILPEVHELDDFAGIRGTPITDIAIRATSGTVSYRVHVCGSGWLPKVTGCNWSDPNNGYAGNGKPIDCVEVVHDGVVAKYRVSPTGRDYYSWQLSNNTGSGMDGYAGAMGREIDRFQLCTGGGPPPRGLPFLQRDSRHPGVRMSGCMFCVACWLGGLNSIGEVDSAFDWCVGQGYVRRSDAYCSGLSREPLGRKIAEHYGRPFKEGFRIAQGAHHFWVVDGSGKEVYNSGGWGCGH